MIAVLVIAVVAALLVYFGGNALSGWAVDRWYMRDEAVAARNRALFEQLQQYVTENDVASGDISAIETWVNETHDVSVIVYQTGQPYEAGWWGTDSLEENVPTPEDLARWYYTLFPLAFKDGLHQVAICDDSEQAIFNTLAIAVLALSFLVLLVILLLFAAHTTKRIVRLSADVNAVSSGTLQRPIATDSRDELSRLAQDVDRMRSAIAERARSEQTALQANSDLVTALSHDIRNPLTSLIGYLELLEMEPLPDPSRQYVLSSLDKAYRIRDLTGELFRYFLVFGQDKPTLHMDTYDAQILLEQLLGEYAAELRGRGFPVHTIPLRTPCQICTDVNMLKRVVDNLESNLEKYADPNARIVFLATLEAGRLHICISNRTQKPRAGAVESNHIGLRTCDAILKLLGGEFHTRADGGTFVAECILPVIESS